MAEFGIAIFYEQSPFPSLTPQWLSSVLPSFTSSHPSRHWHPNGWVRYFHLLRAVTLPVIDTPMAEFGIVIFYEQSPFPSLTPQWLSSALSSFTSSHPSRHWHPNGWVRYCHLLRVDTHHVIDTPMAEFGIVIFYEQSPFPSLTPQWLSSVFTSFTSSHPSRHWHPNGWVRYCHLLRAVTLPVIDTPMAEFGIVIFYELTPIMLLTPQWLSSVLSSFTSSHPSRHWHPNGWVRYFHLLWAVTLPVIDTPMAEFGISIFYKQSPFPSLTPQWLSSVLPSFTSSHPSRHWHPNGWVRYFHLLQAVTLPVIDTPMAEFGIVIFYELTPIMLLTPQWLSSVLPSFTSSHPSRHWHPNGWVRYFHLLRAVTLPVIDTPMAEFGIVIFYELTPIMLLTPQWLSSVLPSFTSSHPSRHWHPNGWVRYCHLLRVDTHHVIDTPMAEFGIVIFYEQSPFPSLTPQWLSSVFPSFTSSHPSRHWHPNGWVRHCHLLRAVTLPVIDTPMAEFGIVIFYELTPIMLLTPQWLSSVLSSFTSSHPSRHWHPNGWVRYFHLLRAVTLPVIDTPMAEFGIAIFYEQSPFPSLTPQWLSSVFPSFTSSHPSRHWHPNGWVRYFHLLRAVTLPIIDTPMAEFGIAIFYELTPIMLLTPQWLSSVLSSFTSSHPSRHWHPNGWVRYCHLLRAVTLPVIDTPMAEFGIAIFYEQSPFPSLTPQWLSSVLPSFTSSHPSRHWHPNGWVRYCHLLRAVTLPVIDTPMAEFGIAIFYEQSPFPSLTPQWLSSVLPSFTSSHPSHHWHPNGWVRHCHLLQAVTLPVIDTPMAEFGIVIFYEQSPFPSLTPQWLSSVLSSFTSSHPSRHWHPNCWVRYFHLLWAVTLPVIDTPMAEFGIVIFYEQSPFPSLTPQWLSSVLSSFTSSHPSRHWHPNCWVRYFHLLWAVILPVIDTPMAEFGIVIFYELTPIMLLTPQWLSSVLSSFTSSHPSRHWHPNGWVRYCHLLRVDTHHVIDTPMAEFGIVIFYEQSPFPSLTPQWLSSVLPSFTSSHPSRHWHPNGWVRYCHLLWAVTLPVIDIPMAEFGIVIFYEQSPFPSLTPQWLSSVLSSFTSSHPSRHWHPNGWVRHCHLLRAVILPVIDTPMAEFGIVIFYEQSSFPSLTPQWLSSVFPSFTSSHPSRHWHPNGWVRYCHLLRVDTHHVIDTPMAEFGIVIFYEQSPFPSLTPQWLS